MDEKTQGAWIIHHTYKLSSVTLQTNEYERVNFAGKCGIILSGLAATNQITVPKKRVEALARASVFQSGNRPVCRLANHRWVCSL